MRRSKVQRHCRQQCFEIFSFVFSPFDDNDVHLALSHSFVTGVEDFLPFRGMFRRLAELSQSLHRLRWAIKQSTQVNKIIKDFLHLLPTLLLPIVLEERFGATVIIWSINLSSSNKRWRRRLWRLAPCPLMPCSRLLSKSKPRNEN